MRIRTTLAAAAALSLCLAGAASAEGDRVRPAIEQPTITIDPQRLEPGKIRLGGEHFRFVNQAERTARVVFDRRRSDVVQCQGPGSDTGRRAQYLVPAGAQLDCTAHGKVDYEVFRQDGSGRLVRHQGQVRAR